MTRLWSSQGWFGLVAFLYLTVFPWHPGLRSPNELCRLWQARAIVEEGSLSLNATMRKYGPVGDLSVVNGVYYPSKAPLMSILAAPVYWVLQKVSTGPVSDAQQVFFSRLFLTIAPTLLMLFWLHRFLREFLEGELPAILVVAYAVGTIAFSYSEAFFSHQTTAVLLFFAFYAAFKVLRGEAKTSGWILSGAFAGAAVMAEYTAALMVVALAAYVCIASALSQGSVPEKLRRVSVAGALVLAGASPFLGALMAYHQACFGHPLESGYKHLADAAYQGWHLGGFLGIRFPDINAFVLSFFSPLRGLFALSPFLFLSVFGLKELKAKDLGLFWLVCLVMAFNAYFTSSFAYESWGWTTGPRHLTPLIPFLLLPIGLLIQTASKSNADPSRVLYGVAVGLVISSMLATGAVTFVNYVPDSLSTSLFGLAVPLFRDGYWPPTLLSFLGLPASIGGIVSFVLLGLLITWVGRQFSRGRALGFAPIVALVLHLSALGLATRNDASDQAAVGHLKSVWWVATPGR